MCTKRDSNLGSMTLCYLNLQSQINPLSHHGRTIKVRPDGSGITGIPFEWAGSRKLYFRCLAKNTTLPTVVYFDQRMEFSCYFLCFSPVCDGKRWKTCFNAKTNDFDLKKECRAPICWSKYTTAHNPSKRLVLKICNSF